MLRTFFVAFGLGAMVLALTVGAGATPTPDATDDGQGQGNASTIIAELGPRLQVLDWQYSDGSFRVLLDAEVPERVVISDALGPVSDKGVSEVPQRELTIDGRQWVEMDVESYRGAAAISVASSSGAIYLSTGITVANPWAGGSPTVGWIGGGIVAVLMFVLAGWWTLRREDSTPVVAGGGNA